MQTRALARIAPLTPNTSRRTSGAPPGMPRSITGGAASPAAPARPPDSAPSSAAIHHTQRTAPRAAPAARRSASATPMLAGVGVLVLANLLGAPYYLAERAERVRHAWHPWLRPSGYVGQAAGILALLIFVFLWLYPLRKKWKALAFTGPIGKWMDVHVTTALWLPLLLTIHAAWRSEGVIGLGFSAMLVVCASGVVGRYLYTRIPRARSGVELTREEGARQREELVERIAQATQLPVDAIERSLAVEERRTDRLSLRQIVAQLLLDDVRRWRMTRELPRRWAALSPTGSVPDPLAVREAVRLASREIALAQQSRMLEATHRVFRFWHVAHRPFALTALVAVLVHVGVVVAVGATWFY